jgi:amino acid transporter
MCALFKSLVQMLAPKPYLVLLAAAFRSLILSLTFMVIAAAAPLTGIAGAVPIAFLLGNGAGFPGTFAIMTVIMLIWATGFVAIARHVRSAGAFYSYTAKSLGGRMGGAVAMMAVLAYNAMMFGLLGLLGGVAAGVFGDLGIDLPWWVWSLLAAGAIGILGYRTVELSAKLLMIIVLLEYAIVLAVGGGVFFQGGAGDLTYNLFDPALIFSGALGAAILFSFGSFIGIEATAIYTEEVQEARTTVPRATYLSIVLIGVFYVSMTWLLVVATGVDALVPTIAALPDPTAYFFEVAEQYAGGPVALLAGLLLVSSIFASATAMHNFIARYLYVSGRDGLLPSFMGVTHDDHQSPDVGSVIQTVMAFIVVVLFAVLELDPILNLFTWIAQISVLSVLSMMAITSFAVIAYFRAHPEHGSMLRTFVAPLVSGILMGGMALCVLSTFGPATGTEPPLAWIFPGLVPAFGVAGYLIASRLARVDPQRFARLGDDPE